jgi:hypothetical protein
MTTFYTMAVLHDDIPQGYLKVKNQVKEQMDTDPGGSRKNPHSREVV